MGAMMALSPSRMGGPVSSATSESTEKRRLFMMSGERCGGSGFTLTDPDGDIGSMSLSCKTDYG
jgi:hypothetical protein